jgi:hypothetical protein
VRSRIVSILACAVLLVVAGAGVAVARSVATTQPATSVTHRAATVHGTVNAGPTGSAWLFEYGTTSTLGSYTKTRSIGSGRKPVAVRFHDLAAGSVYYFRLVVIQGGYTSTARFGQILSFRTKRH